MTDLLDDHQHQFQERPIAKDENLLRFEGKVPYILLSGTAVADICILLEEAGINYELENQGRNMNPVSGMTTSLDTLNVMLHIREEDKNTVDELVADYENRGAPNTSKKYNPLKMLLTSVLIFLLVLTTAFIYLYFFY